MDLRVLSIEELSEADRASIRQDLCDERISRKIRRREAKRRQLPRLRLHSEDTDWLAVIEEYLRKLVDGHLHDEPPGTQALELALDAHAGFELYEQGVKRSRRNFRQELARVIQAKCPGSVLAQALQENKPELLR